MFDAESISLCPAVTISPTPFSHNLQTGKHYPVRRRHLTLPHRLHHAPLLILHIPYPVRLARRDQHVRRPPLHHPV